MRKESTDIDTIHQLAQRFREMMERRGQHIAKLDKRSNKLLGKRTEKLRQVAKSLRLDIDAVYNAITSVYSNGPIEGHINKLKTIKRQMYGRASFELLKRRLVLQSHYDHQT